MKDWILIVLFIVIMIVGGILENNYITTSYETLGQKTTTLQTLINENNENINVETITTAFTDLDTYWRTHEKRLCLFLNHQTLDEVNKELSKMKIDIEYNKTEEVKKSISLILNFVDGYRDYAVLSWESVL